MSAVRCAALSILFVAVLATAGLQDAPAQTKPKTAPKTAEPPAAALTFHIYKDAGGKFRWRLKDDSDTQIGMSSKSYDTKADCQKTIDAIKAGAGKAKVEDETK
jgi:uncharacterized protein YegP (UPF0339 family)